MIVQEYLAFSTLKHLQSFLLDFQLAYNFVANITYIPVRQKISIFNQFSPA